MSVSFAALVLAGGGARRMGGVDKLMLPVEGRPMVQHTLDAVRDAEPIVVVGPRREVTTPVLWTSEEPPGAGPLAGIASGLRELPPGVEIVVLLAGDLPHLSAKTVRKLVADVAGSTACGAVLADSEGLPQWLTSAWRVSALRRELPENARDQSLRSVLADLDARWIPDPLGESADVDTAADLREARHRNA